MTLTKLPVHPVYPVYDALLAPEDADAVAAAVSRGSISGTASIVREFEGAYAAHTGMPHAVAVANGTAALELAVAALGLGPGDEIVCPAFTIVSCVRAIVLAGATPVLTDVDPRSYCLDVEQVREKVGPRTRAILGVHAFGHPYDHGALESVARARGLSVIEDAAEAHGARVRTAGGDLPCGGLGDVSVFSFYANKAVTAGEGGMVLARSREVEGRVRHLANLCFGSKRRFVHEELGHNYRLSGLQAALGLAQLARLDDTIARKRRLAALYRSALAGIGEIELQGTIGDVLPIHWMNALVLSDTVPFDAEALGEALARRGIETRPLFTGMHEQPVFRARGLFVGERYPVTERLSRRGLYLPSAPSLGEDDVKHVASELRAALVELGVARAVVPESPTRGPETAPPGKPFGEAFAEAYDALYASKDYAGEVTLLARCFERFSTRRVESVLDVGCGTGRHSEELAARGFEVVGVDRSAAMLARARARLPGLCFVEADMTTFDVGRTFDAVVILFAALSYQTEPEGILSTLRAARRHLPTGGVLVADVWFGAAPGTGRDVVTRRIAERGGVRWERTGILTRDPLAQRVDAAYELVRRSGGDRSITNEVHRMHYFSPFELRFALTASGFSLAHLSREGDLDTAPGERDMGALFVAIAS